MFRSLTKTLLATAAVLGIISLFATADQLQAQSSKPPGRPSLPPRPQGSSPARPQSSNVKTFPQISSGYLGNIGGNFNGFGSMNFNGVNFNGFPMNFNGLNFNGVNFNGFPMNFNGFNFNGVNFNGFPMNFNGFNFNGVNFNGVNPLGLGWNGWNNGQNFQALGWQGVGWQGGGLKGQINGFNGL
jgi:uncharacterized protein YjbI with pentapeptide repeats